MKPKPTPDDNLRDVEERIISTEKREEMIGKVL